MNPDPVFLHLDLDQFFVSALRLDDASLIGRPVVVGGSDPRARGAVACASYEARAFGVHSGMALRRAWGLCPQAAFVAGNPARFLELSKAVARILRARTPHVVQRSIDEFDVNLTGCERLLGDPEQLALRLREEIDRSVRLDCSLGLAPTPLVAKVASSEGKPRGLVRVAPGEQASFLAPLPIRKLPGVGPRTEERLLELGVTTIGELAALPPATVAQALGARGRSLHGRAQGGASRLEEAAAITPFFGTTHRAATQEPDLAELKQQDGRLPRSLSRERTFGEDQDERAVLDRALVQLVEEAAGSLRVQRLKARTVTLTVRYADLRVQSRSARLPADAQERAVLAKARALLTRLLERRLRVRRLGVAFHGLSRTHEQLLLFEGPNARDQRALGSALDRIRAKHGWQSVRMGSGEGSA